MKASFIEPMLSVTSDLPSGPCGTVTSDMAYHGRNSRSERKRSRKAAILAKRMRAGDGAAALQLLRRRYALEKIAKAGWRWNQRLERATAVRRKQEAEKRAAAARSAEQRRLSEQCTIKDEKVLDAFRARYGCGVFGSNPDSACKPVAPGGVCPNCSWQWGNPEPHTIAIPPPKRLTA